MRRAVMAASGGVLLALVVTLAAGRVPAGANEPAASAVPVFVVDPLWPQPLPNNCLMGQAAGVAVDRRDHVRVVQRPRSLTDDEVHNIAVDSAGNVYTTEVDSGKRAQKFVLRSR